MFCVLLLTKLVIDWCFMRARLELLPLDIPPTESLARRGIGGRGGGRVWYGLRDVLCSDAN